MTGDFPCSTCGNYWCSGHWIPVTIPTAPLPSTNTFNMYLRRLHPDDIEAIAKRVAELLK